MDTLTCNRCHILQSLDAFDKGTNKTHGRRQPCKQCRHEAHAAWRATQPVPESAEPVEPATSKVCSRCKAEKPLDDFPKDKNRADRRHQPCKQCGREAYPPKAEKARKKSRAWYAANTAKASEANRAWVAANPEKNRENQHTWYIANIDKVCAYRAAHRDEIREGDRVRRAARIAANPLKVRAQGTAAANRRRAAKANAPLNDLTHGQWLEIQAAQGYRCAYCGKRCKGKLTQDHVQALSQGGSHTLSNVIGVCRSCNAKKGTRPPPCQVQTLLLTIAPAKKKAS